MESEYTFFSAVHGTFSRTDHMRGHTHTHPHHFKNILFIPCTFSDCHGVKLEINKSQHRKKFVNSWKMNNMLLNEQWVKEEL